MKQVRLGFVFLFSFFVLSSCSLLKKATDEEKAEKQVQEEDKAFMAEIKKKEKAHYKMQPKETKKMMKRSKRASKKLNRPRKLPR